LAREAVRQDAAAARESALLERLRPAERLDGQSLQSRLLAPVDAVRPAEVQFVVRASSAAAESASSVVVPQSAVE
jgi:hypothetical protein